MKAPLLHSVIDDLLCSIERYPEIAGPVDWFIFDDRRDVRSGLYVVKTPTENIKHADGSFSVNVGLEVLASDDLIQFAHAVANGVVPHMALVA